MIRVVYSNHSEQLLEALRDQVAETRRATGPWEPISLVVPNRNVETWVKLGLARSLGAIANLEARFLRGLASDLLHAARPGARLLDAAALQGFLLALLSEPATLRDPVLAPLTAWLAAGGESEDARDLRRFQLSGELARLFDEYALSRPELCEAWRNGRSAFPKDELPPALADTEAWQRRLYRLLFGPQGRAHKTGIEWITLDRLAVTLAPARLPLPRALHVFGLSYVARVFQDLLALLGERTELHLYTLNPCAELWEDVPHARALGGDDPFGLAVGSDPPALKLWGRPGRENIRLLNELSECDFVGRFADPLAARTTVLAQLQRDILDRAAERSVSLGLPRDGSVRVLACPGIRRELEVIAAEIWELLAADEQRAPGHPPLRLSDIAVILPASQKAQYQAHVTAVFSEMHGLPHTVADLPLAAESRVAEGLALLLALPLSSFTRQDLLRVCTHPSVIARFPDAEPETWAALSDTLGIAHGVDHTDHAGTYIDGDVLNWDQGLRRLVLGAFMTGGRSGDDQAVMLGGRPYLPEELAQGRVGDAAGFALLARSLAADARHARAQRQPLAAWAVWFRALASSYLVPRNEADERALRRCLGAIDALAALEPTSLGGQALSYRTVYELVVAQLDGLAGSRGQYLGGGVTIASFLPMRAIPFRVVFVAGLGQGLFPASDRKGPLDLRQASRRAGDVSPREQDCYMFLETLLSARERLYLSYVWRDPVTGDAREPSPVVTDLIEVLGRGYLAQADLLTEHFTLLRHDDPHTRAHSPAAAAEHHAEQLGESLRKYTADALPGFSELREAVRPRVRDALDRALALAPPPRAPEVAALDEQTVTVSLPALRYFLEDPLQGSARFLLGLREHDDGDPSAITDERFETTPLERAVLLRDVFVRTLTRDPSAGAPELESAYDAAAASEVQHGRLPTGPFGDAARRAHLTVLQGWLAASRSVLGSRSDARLMPLRFGPTLEHLPAAEAHDPIVLPIELTDGRRVRVELRGRTEPLVREAPGSLILSLRDDDKPDKKRAHDLRGFLDYAALRAAGVEVADGYTAWTATPSGGSPRAMRYGALSPIEARVWLSDLCVDLISGVHDYLLPQEAVFKHERKPEVSIPDFVETLLEGNDKFSSQFGPVRGIERYDPPSEAQARAIYERRWQPFLKRAPLDGVAGGDE